MEKDGEIIPKIKISENAAKITNPHFKKVWRLYSRETGKAEADLITLHDEVVDDEKPYELFDPNHTWKRKTLTNFIAKPLQVPVFLGGECVYECPSVAEIRQHCAEDIATMWDEVLRFENPHNYYVDLSQKLWDLKDSLLKSKGKR